MTSDDYISVNWMLYMYKKISMSYIQITIDLHIPVPYQTSN